MTIQWFGHGCFRIQGSVRDVSLVTDPFGQELGWRLPRLAADVITVSSDSPLTSHVDGVKSASDDELFIITGPGEYETKGMYILGIPVLTASSEKKSDKERFRTIYSIGVDDVFIAHLGALHRVLTEDELDALGRIDVLLLPVGDPGRLDAKAVREVIDQCEPRIVIPCQYQLPGMKGELASLDQFKKAVTGQEIEEMDKLKLQKKDLPADDTRMILLQAK